MCTERLKSFFFFLIDFKIFGSSPEAQIIVKTVRLKSILLQEQRTGDDEKTQY
jgi:hypothetical protein